MTEMPVAMEKIYQARIAELNALLTVAVANSASLQAAQLNGAAEARQASADRWKDHEYFGKWWVSVIDRPLHYVGPGGTILGKAFWFDDKVTADQACELYNASQGLGGQALLSQLDRCLEFIWKISEVGSESQRQEASGILQQNGLVDPKLAGVCRSLNTLGRVCDEVNAWVERGRRRGLGADYMFRLEALVQSVPREFLP